VRTAFHNAAIDPADVLDLLEVGMPVEDSDDAVFFTMPWAINQVAALSADPAAALARVHGTALATLERAEPGSTLQLSAFQAAASSCADPGQLRSWLDGRVLPDGLEVDLDLRWRILVRLATLGETDRPELDAALAAEPTARSQVEHARATASLPDAEAKAWAWQRFTGEVDVPNYELEATGLGMWRVGQEELTAPYVARYFEELPGTVSVRSGWLLADAAESFFPLTALDDDTLARARALIGREDLEPSLRRQVVDRTDELERRIAVRRRFAAPDRP
jgi:aminopeptidase N